MLPELLLELLAQAGRSAAEIEAIACGVGPGSFTGIRVALAFAHGIAHRRALPIHGTSSLQAALAATALLKPEALARPRVALLDAHRDEAYALRLEPGETPSFRSDGDHRRTLSDIPALLAGDAIVVAEGRPAFLAALPAGPAPMLRIGELLDAGCVARLGLARGEEPLPNYLRASAPEELAGG